MATVACTSYQVFINEDWNILKDKIIDGLYTKVGILIDENSKEHCLPIVQDELGDLPFTAIEIQSGEHQKNLETCQFIWKELMDHGFDRHSLLINLGGGVIGDMGGFCACTYMRGMEFIQIPTTLLSQVDASVGGKLGIDYLDYKNIIGVIKDPTTVWIDDRFLKTLPLRQIRSGYAEIIKYALIQDAQMWNEIKEIVDLQIVDWGPLIEKSVKIKRDIVSQDKYEGGLRKILNFGHTLGHAIESQNLQKDDYLLHGEAIGIGMIVETYIAKTMLDFSEEDYTAIKDYILKIYPHYAGHVEEIDHILEKLLKDKKNKRGMVHFSLIDKIGNCLYDIVPQQSLIIESLEAYKSL